MGSASHEGIKAVDVFVLGEHHPGLAAELRLYVSGALALGLSLDEIADDIGLHLGDGYELDGGSVERVGPGAGDVVVGYPQP